MALTDAQVQYVRTMTSYVKKYNAQYQIDDNCVLGIVAQSCNESNWGKSLLSSRYYNFWGMKCGSGWTGPSVNMETQEETPAGTIKVNSDFRVYSDWENGVIGYFEFLQYPRYDNLKTATTTRQYLELIKADGWATSSSYVNNIMAIANQIDYLVNDTPADSDPQPPQPPPPHGSEPAVFTEPIQIALEVLTGQWGQAMNDIKTNLDYAGYNVDLVLEAVGGILSATYKKKRRKRRK